MAKASDTAENFETCLSGNCSTCPTYRKGSEEGLFCIRGASKTDVVKRGCNCPECPVWAKNGLSGMYYCLSGPSD